MTKFHKRGGGGFTTLKTDWICKNRVHQHKFYGKPRVPKKSSEYDRGSGHFNADEYYLHYEFLPTIMWWHSLRKAVKYIKALEHFLVANEDGPLKSWTFLPRVMGSLSDWLSAQWLMSKYMPWFSWSWIVISTFANCKKLSTFNLEEPD